MRCALQSVALFCSRRQRGRCAQEVECIANYFHELLAGIEVREDSVDFAGCITEVAEGGAKLMLSRKGRGSSYFGAHSRASGGTSSTAAASLMSRHPSDQISATNRQGENPTRSGDQGFERWDTGACEKAPDSGRCAYDNCATKQGDPEQHRAVLADGQRHMPGKRQADSAAVTQVEDSRSSDEEQEGCLDLGASHAPTNQQRTRHRADREGRWFRGSKSARFDVCGNPAPEAGRERPKG